MGKVAINFKEGTIAQNKTDIIVGIDLGTTNSLIAYMQDGKAQIIADANDNTLLVPSIIYYDEDSEQIFVGESAKKQLTLHPESTIYSVKRLMGKSYQEMQSNNHLGYTLHPSEDQNIKIKLKDKYYNPIELSAMILSYLKNRAEHALNQKITKAVITVPSYFNDHQRQATRDAGKLAGMDVLRIINEPTAASLAYGIGLNKNENKIIAVYDLGGGTFDVSILRLEDGIFDVLSTNGNTELGGDDFDQAIIQYWEKNQQLIIPTEYKEKNTLRQFAEKAKIFANQNGYFSGTYNNQNLELNTDILNEILEPFISKTITCCKNAMNDSKLKLNEIDEVILVGGSTRLNQVQNRVSEFFNKTVNTNLNPDQVVALGAAIQADILAGNNKEFLLIDVTPLSLGIETIGGLMDTIIPRNSKIPISQARSYTTSVDGQKNLKVAIFQGERELVEHNHKLGELILKNIPPMPAGLPKIEIQFLINPDGILKVKAKELRTQTEQDIEIKSTINLSEEQMALMLIDSIKNAQADLDKRALIEIKNEVKYLIANYNRFLDQNKVHLSDNEKLVLQTSIQKLQYTQDYTDKNTIQTQIDEINNSTAPIAHRMMDITIQNALSGQSINNANHE